MSEISWTAWAADPKAPDFSDVIYERCTRSTGGSVARLTINRPDRMNSFTKHTMKELMVAIDHANQDPSVGVVVLQGAGDRAFSSGGDVAWEADRSAADWFFDVPPNHVVRFSNQPVIAAVRGYAIGGGNHLAYTCDMTIAADNAVFGQIGSRVGSPADGYMVRYLIRVIGAKRAREMWLTRRRINAVEALEWGLVNAVVPLADLDTEVLVWCDRVLDGSPTCVRILKAVFDQEIDEMAGDVRRTAHLIHPGFGQSAEAREAQQAFFEKRPPRFWPAPDGAGSTAT
ncbi:enoyl-CoA hydratase-related protein [Dactylosporangium sp. AC04546]|uniref:enoyl-CoA hydratase-related protein n=1 Tax=Dactylosporangium sp. AC04546 TaxID=2862460 RepID=UPI001EDFB129|nr:enoyl-CoA hydratase-related protein [Dactylosporangium sp. AC04546]WVK80889.1 enoyl-CoA hydratase-related protein [Dactylosporangium sp. AC04546]